MTLRVFVASGAALLTDRAGHGEGLIAHGLFSELARRGHTLTVCARATDFAVAPPYDVVETGSASSRESVEPLAYARRAAQLFSEHGGAAAFDVVHWLFPQEEEELVYAPPAGVPYVVGPLMPRWPKSTRLRPPKAGDAVRAAIRPMLRRAHRRALMRADAVLVANRATLDVLPVDVRPHAIVVPYGVDAGRFTPTPPPADGSVLFYGKLEQAKGVRDLVEACALVPEARLVLFGDGPERAWLEARGAAVRAAVGHERVPELLATARLVCLPSHGEPYGMAVLESMASGRAVVTTDVGGPRELIVDGQGGALVPPGDVPTLAAAIARLLPDDAVLARMGAFNRARVESDLSLARSAERVEAVYRAAAQRQAA